MDDKEKKYLGTFIRWNPQYAVMGDGGFWKVFFSIIFLIAVLTAITFGIGRFFGDRAFGVAVRFCLLAGGVGILSLVVYAYLTASDVADRVGQKDPEELLEESRRRNEGSSSDD